MRTRSTLTIAAAAAALLLSACGSATDGAVGSADRAVGSSTAPASASTPSASPSATPAASASASASASATASAPPLAAGAYLTKAEYQGQMAARAGTTVVYFFHAPWCPTCRATEKSIDADGVPAGLTLVKVDFDTETDLRRQYGITQQHTFVQVDEDGGELAKWTGSMTGADIEAKTV